MGCARKRSATFGLLVGLTVLAMSLITTGVWWAGRTPPPGPGADAAATPAATALRPDAPSAISESRAAAAPIERAVAAPATTAAVKGVVTDPFGKGIAHCVIRAEGAGVRDVEADPSGGFEIPGLQRGAEVELLVFAPEGSDAVWRGPMNAFAEAGGPECRIVVEVVHEPWSSVAISVVNGDDGVPAVIAQLLMTPAVDLPASFGRLPRTTWNGSTAFCDQVLAGAWNVEVDTIDGRRGRATFDLGSGESRPLVIPVFAPVQLRVQLSELHDERWVLQLFPRRGQAVGLGKTTPGFALLPADGVVTMHGVPANEAISVQLRSPNWLAFAAVTTVAGESASVTAVAVRKATVRFQWAGTSPREATLHLRGARTGWEEQVWLHSPGLALSLPPDAYHWTLRYYQREPGRAATLQTRTGGFTAAADDATTITF